MTTKDKIKAFIEENAKYKVGQTVYYARDIDSLPCKAKVTGIGINTCKTYFTYEHLDGYSIGYEGDLYSTFEELRTAIAAELEAKAQWWRDLTDEDVIDRDNDF